jgi:hypothetical protein
MQPYPYTARDLFAQPENYFFASCAGEDFLKSWRVSRTEFRGRLERAAPGRLRGAPPAGPELPGVNVHRFLEELLGNIRSGKMGMREAAATVQPYLVKYEVSKRLFTHYGEDRRRHPDSVPVGLGTYLLFGACLAELADAGNSLKHLSVLLKVCDALASQPADAYAADETAMLAALLKKEDALVARVEGAHVNPV